MAGVWPLVGRQEELAYAIRAVSDGSTGGIVLAGAAGVGKSRLATEILAQLDASGGTVIRGAATKASASIPFAAVTELVPDIDITAENRLAVFRAVVEALESRGADRIVVGLDDAHLADEPTAALLHHLVTRKVCAVVVTIRSGEMAPDAVTALWKDANCARLDVQPLARVETDELAAAALGGAVERPTLDRLWDLSAGNALLLRELILQALDEDAIDLHRGFWRWKGSVGTSGRLADVVRFGLGRLTAEERETVALLAYGEPIGLTAFEAIADPATIARLIDRGVATVAPDERRRNVTLSHPLYGEVIRGETPAAQSTRLVRTLAEDLLGRGIRRSGDAGRLGRWALDAGIELPHEVLARAALEAKAVNDDGLCERLCRADPDWPIHVTGLALGSAIGAMWRFDEAYEVLTTAAVSPPDDEYRARIAYYRVELLAHTFHRHEEAAEVFAQAMAEIEDPKWRDLLAVAWAPTLIVTGRRDEAMALLGPMADAVEPRTRLASLRGLAYLLVPSGQTGRVIELCDELLPAAFELRHDWWYGLSDLMSARVLALLMEGRLAEATDVLALAESAAAEIGTDVLGFVTVVKGRVALFRGEPVTAARLVQEGAATFTRMAYGFRGTWSQRLLGEARALLGDAAGAQDALEEADTTETPLRYPMDSDEKRAMAWVSVGVGRTEEGRDRLRAEIAEVRGRGEFGYEAMLAHDLARLGSAEEVAARLAKLAVRVDGPIATAYAAHAAALVAADGAALEKVSADFEALGFRLLAAEAAAEASGAFRAVGLVARANATTTRSGALRARCEGAQTPALTLAIAEVALTAREREIATLAARGMTSKAIAEAAHVSPRTVDNHLQRVFSKLGVRRREELSEALGLEFE